VTVLETIVTYGVTTVGLYLLLVLLVVVPRRSRAGRARYRVGQPWPYEPVFWTANPEGAQLPPADGHPVAGDRGGARGSW
jgi:hypothetical protein